MLKTAKFLMACVAALCAIAPAGAAQSASRAAADAIAAAYPTHPIDMVVTFPPGGGTDLLARRLAAPLGDALGQSVVVENRAGASGNIGAQIVARAKPDGYTLLMVNSTYAINPGVYRHLGFSPRKDLIAVINIAFVPSVLITASHSPWKTLHQVLSAQDKKPGAATPTFASCGNGTPQHLAAEMLLRRADATWLHVPYRGCGPALQSVLARNVDVGFVTVSSALPLLRAGSLRALAVTSPQRSPLLPNVPTVAEQGFPGYELNQWHGVLAPAGTPPAIIERLNTTIAAIMRRPDMVRGLRSLGYDTATSTPRGFQSMIDQDIAKFGVLTKQIGLKVD